MDDIHEAFKTLNERGLLQTREVPRAPRRMYSERELESMPLDQLRELAEAEARRGDDTA